MPIDIDQSYYATGTATVAAGGTVVTGQGTQWQGAVRAGDLFGSHVGMPVRIASVDSNTQLTLAYPWAGAAQDAAAYEIQFTPYKSGYQEAVRQLLLTLASGSLEAIAGLDAVADTLPYFTGEGQAELAAVTAFARALFGGADASAARETLGAVGAIRIKRMTASGIYYPDDALIFGKVGCQAAGGGGGAVAAAAAYGGGGGGGGGGGYSEKYFTKNDIGISQAVTVGIGGNGSTASGSSGAAGGNTSFGTLCVANGGKGGASSGGAAATAGGSGGDVSGAVGDLTVCGEDGYSPLSAQGANFYGCGGRGGSSRFGTGVSDSFTVAGSVAKGSAGRGYGSGGNGGAQSQASSGIGQGGNGAYGLCVIVEFCSK